jgi:hypothetical protein
MSSTRFGRRSGVLAARTARTPSPFIGSFLPVSIPSDEDSVRLAAMGLDDMVIAAYDVGMKKKRVIEMIV